MWNSDGMDSGSTPSGFWAVYTDLSFNLQFKIKGCRVGISYYFFAMTAALVLLCHDYLFFCGIFAAAIHECGHIAAISLCRHCCVSRIDIGALGIRITAQGNSVRPVIILAGVIANFAFAAAACPLLFSEIAHGCAFAFIVANLCLALCNILPIEPLDGGVLLRYFAERYFSPTSADRMVIIVSVCSLIPLAAAGLFASMQSSGNFSLLILCLWLLAGILRRYI